LVRSISLVKADLEAVYEEAIRRRDQIREEITSADPSDDLGFTDQDSARLAELTKRIEALWAAPTTTNEDRKQLLRLVLDRVIVLTSTKEEVELEVVWVGLRDRLHVQRRAELDAQVRRLRQANATPRTIVGALRATGVPSATGKPASKDVVRRSLVRVGLNRAAVRLQILRRIRELALEGHSRRQMMQALDQEFPVLHHRWTHDRLYRAIRRLRRGVPGLEPLPAGLLETPDMIPVRAFVRQGRAEGKTWKQIAADLNAAGLRPTKAQRFWLFQVMELMRRRPRQARSATDPARAPHPSHRP
jgi:hypothetical protein